MKNKPRRVRRGLHILKPYRQSGRFAAAVVEPDDPAELPLSPAEPLLPEPDAPLPTLDEPEEPELPRAEEPELLAAPVVEPPDMEPELPVPVEPLPEELEPATFEPEVVEPALFEAVFNRAWPVVLSLQCVAADTFELPLADGEVVD
jgi:hypothetical protein